MSLVTRCPVCTTTFRVLPAQLSARSGRVRCGKCAEIFDGVSSLLTDEAVAALSDEPSPQMGLFDTREAKQAASDTAEIAAADIASPTTEMLEPVPVAPAPQDRFVATNLQAPPGQPGLIPAKQTPAAPNLAFLSPVPPRANYTLVWTLLGLLGIGALCAQAALHFRTEIAVLLPLARTHMETACDILGCEVRLPRRADLMSIESSDLQADTQRQGVIILNALLRNRAPYAQEYPGLELTLTDHGDRPVIRRVLKPDEYLRQKSPVLARGIPGGAEESVRIHFDTSGILATGYQLFLFYPCPSPASASFWHLSYSLRC